ncbi:MAG: 30S ribosomal protein S2 [Rickettsiales bacterium]|jgi:small subunit ribosomal protein S2|nr:30S ribosomal protein S2 [Rickettsiales bacterium]
MEEKETGGLGEADLSRKGQEEISQDGGMAKKPLFTMRELLEAGVHFGHRTMRWNAKMAPYIYGTRSKIHIIDLTQTAILMTESMRILKEIVRKRGRILFVCTKKQGAESVRNLAEEVGQFYVVHKWLGGMLTNWKTVSQSIKKIKMIESQLSDRNSKILKKEQVVLNKTLEKLTNNLNGIRTMGNLPDLLFVFDVLKESLAVNEARALGIPIMAIVDTNSNPDVVDYPIPGNDDSIKAIQLYCRIIADTLRDIKLPKPKPELPTRRSGGRSARVESVEGFDGFLAGGAAVGDGADFAVPEEHGGTE